jgi:hypothetical protein
VLLVGLLAFGLYTPSVYADSVTLTSGTVSVLANVGTINLAGPNFSLNYTGDVPGGSSMGINSVSLSLGSPSVTFNGVTSNFFNGSLGFTSSSITGTVTAFGSMNDLFFNTNPLFSVTFTGNGFVTITSVGGATQTQFTVTPTSVPEPATLLQLFAGLASSGFIFFRRSAKSPPS